MTQELHGVISLGGTVIGGSLNQRGLKGETGNGIESVVMTEEYDLVITYTNGDVVTLDTGLDDYEELLKGYKDDAESAKSDAESAKTDAVDAKNDAVSAKNDAVSAKNDAESAKSDAVSAKNDAVSAKNDAVSAKTDAQSAKTAAETAQGKAEDAQGYAETAQTAAETAATNANTYQGWAQNYASNAQTQAGYASTHRWAAYDSQVAAAASALVSEGYANGEQNGTPVTSDSSYYHNNAKYYSEQFIRAFPTDTASGAIASFPDGSDLFDYLSCIVNIEPVQDLHGYDKPWVGGSGANLLNSDYAIKFTLTKTITFPQTVLSGTKVYVHSDEFNYTTPPSSGNKYPYYVFRGANNENCGQVWGLQDTSVTLSGDAVAIELWSNGYDYGASSGVEVTISGLTISKTEQTTYSPYENICPISGRTEVVTQRTGKNLLDVTNLQFASYNKYGIPNTLKNNTTYTMSVFGDSSNTFGYGLFAGHTNVAVPQPNIRISNYYVKVGNHDTFTTPSDIEDWEYLFLGGSGEGAGHAEAQFQLELSTTATDYEPYEGSTYTTDLGRTVYGGTLDVVSGVLTVDRKLVNIDPSTVNINAVVTGGGRYIVTTTDAKDVQTSAPIAYTICNTLKSITSDSIEIGGSSLISSKRLSFMLPVSTQAEARQWFTDNPTTVVYPLAQAQTYQLDPVQVACLLGQNNVWADCGDVAVKYKADVQKWVEKQLREINTAILALS